MRPLRRGPIRPGRRNLAWLLRAATPHRAPPVRCGPGLDVTRPDASQSCMATEERPGDLLAGARSRWALNAVNFFLAQLTGIGSPYLGVLLRARGWPYDAIGIAVSASGLGVLLFQPA